MASTELRPAQVETLAQPVTAAKGRRPLKIIVTRPEPDASAFAKLAREAGFEPILSPAMTVAFSSAPPQLEGVGALAFTSANGVRAFAAAGGPSMLPVFAVGGITAAEAGRLGFPNATSAVGDVASLAKVVSAAFAEGRFTGTVLHIGGTDRAGDLVGALAARGMTADLAVLYEAVPAASLSKEAAATLAAAPPAVSIALFSPRSARIFADLVVASGLEPACAKIEAYCISAATAAALGPLIFARVAVAGEPNQAAMLDLIPTAGPTP